MYDRPRMRATRPERVIAGYPDFGIAAGQLRPHRTDRPRAETLRFPFIRWLMPYLCRSSLRFPRAAQLLAVVAIAGCQTHQPGSTVSQLRPIDSVAVGYGTQARRDITGAVASLDGDVARRNSPTSMADMLEGRFAGVEV